MWTECIIKFTYLVFKARERLGFNGALCPHLKHVAYIWSPAHALGGVGGVASFITTDEQLPRLLFSRAGYAS